jgi:hypothetical protein
LDERACVGNAAGLERIAADRGDGDRHFLEIFGAMLGSDNNLLQLAVVTGFLRIGCPRRSR